MLQLLTFLNPRRLGICLLDDLLKKSKNIRETSGKSTRERTLHIAT